MDVLVRRDLFLDAARRDREVPEHVHLALSPRHVLVRAKADRAPDHLLLSARVPVGVQQVHLRAAQQRQPLLARRAGQHHLDPRPVRVCGVVESGQRGLARLGLVVPRPRRVRGLAGLSGPRERTEAAVLQRARERLQAARAPKVRVHERGARAAVQPFEQRGHLAAVRRQAARAQRLVAAEQLEPRLARLALREGHVAHGPRADEKVVGHLAHVPELHAAPRAPLAPLHRQVAGVLVRGHGAAHDLALCARERGRRRPREEGHQPRRHAPEQLDVAHREAALALLQERPLELAAHRERRGGAQQVEGQRQLDRLVEDGRRGQQQDAQVRRRRRDRGLERLVMGSRLAHDVLHLVHDEHRVLEQRRHGLPVQLDEAVHRHDGVVRVFRPPGPAFGQLAVKVADERGREHDYRATALAAPGLGRADGGAGLARAQHVEHEQAAAAAARPHVLPHERLLVLDLEAGREAQLPEPGRPLGVPVHAVPFRHLGLQRRQHHVPSLIHNDEILISIMYSLSQKFWDTRTMREVLGIHPFLHLLSQNYLG